MTILDLSARLGLRLKKKTSNEYAGACPKCGCGKDRFLVWPKSEQKGGNFWCRKCNYKGDGIQLLRDQLGLSYPEACGLLGIETEALSRPRRWQSPDLTQDAHWTPEPIRYPDINFAMRLEEVIDKASLPSPIQSMGTLHRRGIRTGISKLFRLGYHPLKSYFAPLELGIARDEYANDKEWEKSRICLPAGDLIPIYADNRLVSVKVRRSQYGKPGDRGPKYQVLKGSGAACGVWHPWPEERPVIIVESELDAVLLFQEAWDLITPISLGSATNKPDKRAHDLISQAPSVLIALDNDSAGQKGWEWWNKQYPESYRVIIRTCKSAGDYFEQGGDLREWVRICLIQSGHYAPPASPLGTLKEIKPVLSRDGEEMVEIIRTDYYQDSPSVLSLSGGLRLRNFRRKCSCSLDHSNLLFTARRTDVLPLKVYAMGLDPADRDVFYAQYHLRAIRARAPR